MHAHRHRTTRSLGLLAAVFLVIGTASTITRIPAGGELHAQTTWRGLVVAPEQRCSPYDADDYRYPQSVEDRIVAGLGGVYGPYTGRWFASKSDTVRRGSSREFPRRPFQRFRRPRRGTLNPYSTPHAIARSFN